MDETKAERMERVVKLAELLARVANPEIEAHAVHNFRADHYERAEALIRLAGEHAKLAEHACNRELTAREVEREKTIEREIAAQLRAVRADGGSIGVTFEGDPRGYTVKLHLPPIDGRKPHNTWGGAESGWGI